MSAPPGSAASSSTETAPSIFQSDEHASLPRPRPTYVQELALRREAALIHRQIGYGLVMGWILTLVGGFLFFCVPSRLDPLWCVLAIVGLLHLAAATIVPQALAWPERVWAAVARWQGRLVMAVLLTVIYFALIWPASYFVRRRTGGFRAWNSQTPNTKTSWRPMEEFIDAAPASPHYRSLPLLLAGILSFFFRRGDYVLVLIVVLLVILGLLLYFVESSALAPFIYTLF
jgi:hypothetical protein